MEVLQKILSIFKKIFSVLLVIVTLGIALIVFDIINKKLKRLWKDVLISLCIIFSVCFMYNLISKPHFNYIPVDNTIAITEYNQNNIWDWFRKTVIIPKKIDNKKVTIISGGAFKNCNKLISVAIPDSVTSIGDNAFANCTNLKTVSIPDGTTYIGNNAFVNCTNLTIICSSNSVAYEYCDKTI